MYLFPLLLAGTLSLSPKAAGDSTPYWNSNSCLIPWRLPPTTDPGKITYLDLNGDGNPDVLKTTLPGGIPAIWIDDNANMQHGDLEGDQTDDCLVIDLNKDGIFGGPGDLIVDWTDTNGDGIADIQLVIRNGSRERRHNFDWNADFMYIIDFGEKDGIQNFIDWRQLALRCWEHSGHSNFYTDYHGNTLFLKMHGSPFNIADLRYNWENPFIFFDKDNDGLTEMTVRMVDTPAFRPPPGKNDDPRFDRVAPEHSILFSHRITWAALSWDLDNDNGPGNEFDMDMSIRFTGPGFDYSDQTHHYAKLRGLPEADSLLFDPRWRQNTELIYPDPRQAEKLIFKRGDWNACWFVFDEDDDCNRWERVEFYEPLNLFSIGAHKGGLDNNAQADAVGDRGEWDTDNSGDGNLYIAPFDGRLHLYGAEWGAWRIDPSSRCFQGYGGLYPPCNSQRLAADPENWATVRYEDSDGNGFFDIIEYDLDGDGIFEERVSLKELGIDDRANVIDLSSMDYEKMQKLFARLTDDIWSRAGDVQQAARRQGVSTDWYNFWKQPRSLHERYAYGYWLTFYLYRDMRHKAGLEQNAKLIRELDKAYYSGSWKTLLDRSL